MNEYSSPIFSCWRRRVTPSNLTLAYCLVFTGLVYINKHVSNQKLMSWMVAKQSPPVAACSTATWQQLVSHPQSSAYLPKHHIVSAMRAPCLDKILVCKHSPEVLIKQKGSLAELLPCEIFSSLTSTLTTEGDRNTMAVRTEPEVKAKHVIVKGYFWRGWCSLISSSFILRLEQPEGRLSAA